MKLSQLYLQCFNEEEKVKKKAFELTTKWRKFNICRKRETINLNETPVTILLKEQKVQYHKN